MQRYNNLTIIGTSHISIESINEVKKSIKAFRPDIIALELDPERFHALTHKKRKISFKDMLSLGLQGFFFNIIGAYIEKKLGEVVRISPGSEMKAAIKLAKKNKIQIALIDQNIRVTLKKLSKRITLKEKVTFIKELLLALIKRKRINIDLTKVPSQSLITELVNNLKKNYPSVYLTLIKERNEILAYNLLKLLKTKKTILAIVGAGHEQDILNLVKKKFK